MSKAKTVEEAREEFLEHAKMTAEYWAELPDKTPSERCKGLLFSMMVLFDGGSGEMPAYDIVISPHPDDKQYNIDMGADYYEENMVINDCQLHELL